MHNKKKSNISVFVLTLARLKSEYGTGHQIGSTQYPQVIVGHKKLKLKIYLDMLEKIINVLYFLIHKNDNIN